ncbi:hypothetical protein Ciccas_008319 [Cichlidogyrus casuarinus]|uniref:Uncharacterized protein n=1 Tax=Cichlidogyrus casuarinus TaxID=1844966 RepID=A0ABD2Q0B4_9PLAT
MPLNLTPVGTGILEATYVPEVAAPSKVLVMQEGTQVPGSPFHVNVRPAQEVNKVHVYGNGVNSTVPASLSSNFTIDARDAGSGKLSIGLTVRNQIPEKVSVGHESMIQVDCSRAGPGQLMARIYQVGELIPIDMESMESNPGVKSLYYMPKSIGLIKGEIRFGGQPIPGGTFVQYVVTPDELSRPEPKRANEVQHVAQNYYPVEFKLPCMPLSRSTAYKAIVIRPNGKQVDIPVEDHFDGTLSVRYQPEDKGMHELHVMNVNKKAGTSMPLPGSPYRFFVDSVSTGQVSAHGPGLTYGVTGQKAEFTIVTKDAGGGGLSLSIEGPSKVEINCHDNGDGTCTISYVPLVSGEYTISIKFHDKDINGSPFTAKVTGKCSGTGCPPHSTNSLIQI